MGELKKHPGKKNHENSLTFPGAPIAASISSARAGREKKEKKKFFKDRKTTIQVGRAQKTPWKKKSLKFTNFSRCAIRCKFLLRQSFQREKFELSLFKGPKNTFPGRESSKNTLEKKNTKIHSLFQVRHSLQVSLAPELAERKFELLFFQGPKNTFPGRESSKNTLEKKPRKFRSEERRVGKECR